VHGDRQGAADAVGGDRQGAADAVDEALHRDLAARQGEAAGALVGERRGLGCGVAPAWNHRVTQS
jgi:hypothetical protein